MSASDRYVSVKDINNSLAEECERAASVPLDQKNKPLERDIVDFLNDIVIKNDTSKNIDSESSSVTINEDISSSDGFRPQFESLINCNDSIHDAQVSLNIGTESLPIIGVHTNDIESPLVDDESFKMADDSDKLTFIGNTYPTTIDGISVITQSFQDNCEHKATPTAKPVINENNSEIRKYEESPPDYQIFVDQLNKLSATVQQKDEEIKKLTEKLLDLESNETDSKGAKEKIIKKSPSSSASDESLTFTDEIMAKTSRKTKHTPVTNETRLMDTPVCADDGKKVTKNSVVSETETISTIVNISASSSREEIIPEFRKKLTELEEEVSRLKRANVDSLLTLQGIQNNNPSYDKAANESVINRLLVDHSVLKEELDQLKWEHSKIAQPNLLGEEIKQLKVEVNALRTQNELLQKYVNSSSKKSLNKSSNENVWRNSLEDLDEPVKETQYLKERPFLNNNSSDYIYEKLNTKRRTTSETPNVTTMLKFSIDSLESPYHATCQSMKHTVPFGGGETFRARKLSDSSSALIEDITPKVWLEPVSVNCKPMHYMSPNLYEFPRDRKQYQESDRYSVDSFITVTTSVTEADREDWKYANTKEIGERCVAATQHCNTDLLSASESDTVVDSTDRDGGQVRPKYSYSFTPKSPVDLTLDDLVKFARPGGKMSTGRVCFVGHLPGRREICVGLELDEDAGKHDGMFEGLRYFQCRRNRGVFISFHKIILAYKSI